MYTGSTASTRKAAAKQIGEVVKVHPDELQMLMCRVHTCLRSKSWDTRIAAGEAFEASCASPSIFHFFDTIPH